MASFIIIIILQIMDHENTPAPSHRSNHVWIFWIYNVMAELEKTCSRLELVLSRGAGHDFSHAWVNNRDLVIALNTESPSRVWIHSHAQEKHHFSHTWRQLLNLILEQNVYQPIIWIDRLTLCLFCVCTINVMQILRNKSESVLEFGSECF